MVSQTLARWFLASKREMPWRESPTPYAVWVSEVMLQQTQVAVVIPYFQRWMIRFPNVLALSEASQDEVIKMWEGLGYYSRARNLYFGAKEVVSRFGGNIPATSEELLSIKGIGPYTVGAILSFAFHQKIAAVDGNVMRVLSRFYGIEQDIMKQTTVRHVRELAEALLPEKEPWIVAEALIELGALVCQKVPKCRECPLKHECVAYQQGLTSSIPFKEKKTKITSLFRTVAVIAHGEDLLVRRGKEGEIMNDLHEFPYFETSPGTPLISDLTEKIMQAFSLNVEYRGDLPEINHSFTRYRVKLAPFYYICKEKREVEGMVWKKRGDLQKLAFSSGHRRLFQMLNAPVLEPKS